MTTKKMNETFIREILKNNSEEEAIRKIAEAMTNRDEIIKKLRR
jgi:uncharacterized protein YpiB (UPF0302 family)